VFLERGVDPKARNTAGVTALELLFTTKDEPMFEIDHDYDRFYDIGQEILGAFEQEGYILTETNTANQTLLHLVAELDSDRARPWFDLLKNKGLDVETTVGKLLWIVQSATAGSRLKADRLGVV